MLSYFYHQKYRVIDVVLNKVENTRFWRCLRELAVILIVRYNKQSTSETSEEIEVYGGPNANADTAVGYGYLMVVLDCREQTSNQQVIKRF